MLAIRDTGIGISREDLPGYLKRGLRDTTAGRIRSQRGSACICVKRLWISCAMEYISNQRWIREQRCTCIWSGKNDPYRNVRLEREMSSKSMEGHFSLFYNGRCKDIEEKDGYQMALLDVKNVKKIYNYPVWRESGRGAPECEFFRRAKRSMSRSWERAESGKTTLLNILDGA